MQFYIVGPFCIYTKGKRIMIKIRIRNTDHEVDIHFPISESELFANLGEIHAVEGRNATQSVHVSEVYWPEEFSMLKDHSANLDELNYLAKRMESFSSREYDQFLIGLSKLDSKDVKDLKEHEHYGNYDRKRKSGHSSSPRCLLPRIQ